MEISEIRVTRLWFKTTEVASSSENKLYDKITGVTIKTIRSESLKWSLSEHSYVTKEAKFNLSQLGPRISQVNESWSDEASQGMYDEHS